MPRPASESALVAEKKPPMLQPKARTAPTPIRSPPKAPFTSSPRGGTRTANSLDSSAATRPPRRTRSEEHTSELQSRLHLVCRLLLEKKKKTNKTIQM